MGVTIEAQDLAIGYPGHEVGSGITLAAAPGAVLCLLGPNGSGKTTLFKTLLGLLPARDGRVLLAGQPLDSLSRAEIARRVAYVPQAHAAPFAYSALEVVLMGRTARLGLFAQPAETAATPPATRSPACTSRIWPRPTTPGSPAASASSC